ncbi:MAG: glycosyl hydrolase [Acidobacteria bacterium]|nr:MAG: glycosyl hydrolase [Acidobacteriota bacterium]
MLRQVVGFGRQFVLAAVAVCFVAPVGAVASAQATSAVQQKPPAREPAPTAAKPVPAVAPDTKPAPEPIKSPPGLKHLKYRSIGPFFSGRVSRAAGVPGDPRVYYAATASGGVWKSVDAGISWKSVFDNQPISSIGSIAVAPSDPNVVYVGSGEANIRGNVAAGNGIYKSTDAGKTWKHVWRQEGQIGTMIVHPSNPDVAFAAVLGHAFGPNAERGVYRTRDGGKTWEQVLKKDADTGASDVAFDPSNPTVLFAGLWQARRSPWNLVSGGPGSGLYVSRDSGDTWQRLEGKGLPAGGWGKVGVAVAPSDGRRVYALIEAEEGGLFRSDDGGENWQRASGHRSLRQRAWYYSTMAVDPQNPDVVWFPQVPMLKTIDGGKTIKFVRGLHYGDNHDAWIDPKDPRRIIVSNDGGLDVTVNGGDSWYAPQMPTGQLYHVAVDNRVPFHVSGALQDLGTAAAPSNTLNSNGIQPSDWYNVGGGEAGHTAHDRADPNVVYAGEYLGYISAFDFRTRTSRNISAWPDNPSGHGAEDMKYRFQWTAPIALSPHDPRVLYHAANVLFKTTDRGQTWTAISPDLTRNDKTKQAWSGGPITGDNTGVETYGTIFALVESPLQRDLIWAGTDDGLVQVTRDAGKTWKNVTAAMPGMPEWGTVSLIEPSPFDAGTAYVVVDAHRLDDMRPHLFRTTDYGASWSRLDGALAKDVYLHAVREDPAKKGTLYVGTERGVMVSVDAGSTWHPLQLNLPTVAVHDLVVKDNSLVLATHGRSAWILDDLVPVREMSAAVAASPAHLFTIPEATAWRYHSAGSDKVAGQNPPAGAVIYYHLAEKPKGLVTLEILDGEGKTVRTLTSAPKELDASYEWEEEEPETDPKKPDLAVEPGVQRAVWDLRWQGAAKIKGAKIDTGDPKAGPRALPGRYTAKLTVDGQTCTAPLVVKQDPRVTVAEGDLGAQLRLALAARDDISRLTGIVNRLRSVATQLGQRVEALKGDARAVSLVKASQELMAKCKALEAKLHNPEAEVVYDILARRGGTKLYSRIIPLFHFVADGDGAPTQGMQQVYAEQRKELQQYDDECQALMTKDLAAVNKMAGELGIGFVIVSGGN